jgi:hypothetical protein
LLDNKKMIHIARRGGDKKRLSQACGNALCRKTSLGPRRRHAEQRKGACGDAI